MSIVKKILTAVMFIMYLLALSQATFGNNSSDSLVRSKPVLISVDRVKSIYEIKHKCLMPGETEDLQIEILVDKRGFVSEYKIPDCLDTDFQKALEDNVKHLVFVPAFSVAGVPIPYVYKLQLELTANL